MVENVIDLRFIFSHKCLVFRFTTVTFKLSLPLATNNSCSESLRKLSEIRTLNIAIDLRKIMNNKTLYLPFNSVSRHDVSSTLHYNILLSNFEE